MDKVYIYVQFLICMHSHGVDTTDRIILQELLNDSRTPVRTLASKSGVSLGTVVNRIRHLEESGVIKRYTISVDYESLGYSFEAIISMKIAKGKYPEVAEELTEEQSVITIYDVTGEQDAIVIALFPSRDDLDQFLKRVQSHPLVEKTSTMLVLRTSKESELRLI